MDDQFVDCVYKLKDALDWFENYLEMMDKARKALEKFAMEQAELASNADKLLQGEKTRLRFASTCVNMDIIRSTGCIIY